MRGRVGALIGFGAGYVLGAKAGKERYEQLRRLYDNLVASPAFQEASTKAKGAVSGGLEQAKAKAPKVSGIVVDRGDDASNLSVAPPPI
jgi:hypothetical protein